MARFDELQNAYDHAAKERAAYWSHITAGTQQLMKEFAEYLGVDPSHRVNVQGSAPLPALSIGWFDQSQKFDFRPYENLPRDGESLVFAIRIVFGVDKSGEVPIDAVFKLSITQGDDSDVFVVHQAGLIEDDTFRGPSFRLLFDSLTQSALISIRALQRS